MLDVDILIEPIEIERFDALELPEKESWGFVMPKDETLAKKDYIEAQDILDRDLFVSLRIDERTAQNFFGNRLNDFKILGTFDMLVNVLPLVSARLALAYTIKGAETLGQDLCFRPIGPKLESTSVLVWKKYQPQSFATKKFRDLTREELK